MVLTPVFGPKVSSNSTATKIITRYFALIGNRKYISTVWSGYITPKATRTPKIAPLAPNVTTPQ